MTRRNIFTLAHLSDPHMCSLKDLRAHELMNKRILGYLSWRLHRNAVHRDDVLTAMVQDLHALNPDHIVVTGDLTHLGTAGQFQMAQQFLHNLGPPTAVTVIPGNHDYWEGIENFVIGIPKIGAVDLISISEKKPRRRVPRKRLYDLLSRPPRCRVLGDMEVHDPASVVGEDNQDEEYVEPNRWNHEEVQGHQFLRVVGEERSPRGRRRLGATDPVLLHRGLGDVDAELPQLAFDPR